MRDPLVEPRPRHHDVFARTIRAQGAPPPHAPRARRILTTLLVALLGGAAVVPAGARGASEASMQGLDEKVQEIKSDVLGIAAELRLLEERLLHPSTTQVAVFVSLQARAGETFRLDSVRIEIDGAPVAHHIYRFEELEALQKGGVQRIYTGNVATGEHRLDVSIVGKLAGGGEIRRTERFDFSKGVGPRLVEVALGANASGAEIRIGSR